MSELRLFSPAKLTKLFELPHRCVLAPLTRCRADKFGILPKEAATYYAQRATAGGLLISEATNVSRQAQGYPNTPGIWSDEQVESWKPVTAAVRGASSSKGNDGDSNSAVFFCQLWHTGRVSSSSYQPDGGAPVSASATRFEGEGGVSYETARPLSVDEIGGVVASYRKAACNAVAAGFDGVEVHSANGYLLEQFLRLSSNRRPIGDPYGPGSFESRARLTLEAVAAAAEGAGGAERVGVRLSPYGQFLMGSVDDDAAEFYKFLVKELAKAGVAYVHVIEPRMTNGNKESEDWNSSWSLDPLRNAWYAAVREGDDEANETGKGNSSSSLSSSSSPCDITRPFISAGGFNRERALEHVDRHRDDLIAFGRWWLSTPDFVDRLRHGKPFNRYDRATFYAGKDVAEGYTDYPTLDEVERQMEEFEVKEHYDGSEIFVRKTEAK